MFLDHANHYASNSMPFILAWNMIHKFVLNMEKASNYILDIRAPRPVTKAGKISYA